MGKPVAHIKSELSDSEQVTSALWVSVFSSVKWHSWSKQLSRPFKAQLLYYKLQAAAYSW